VSEPVGLGIAATARGVAEVSVRFAESPEAMSLDGSLVISESSEEHLTPGLQANGAQQQVDRISPATTTLAHCDAVHGMSDCCINDTVCGSDSWAGPEGTPDSSIDHGVSAARKQPAAVEQLPTEGGSNIQEQSTVHQLLITSPRTARGVDPPDSSCAEGDAMVTDSGSEAAPDQLWGVTDGLDGRPHADREVLQSLEEDSTLLPDVSAGTTGSQQGRVRSLNSRYNSGENDVLCDVSGVAQPGSASAQTTGHTKQRSAQQASPAASQQTQGQWIVQMSRSLQSSGYPSDESSVAHKIGDGSSSVTSSHDGDPISEQVSHVAQLNCVCDEMACELSEGQSDVCGDDTDDVSGGAVGSSETAVITVTECVAGDVSAVRDVVSDGGAHEVTLHTNMEGVTSEVEVTVSSMATTVQMGLMVTNALETAPQVIVSDVTGCGAPKNALVQVPTVESTVRPAQAKLVDVSEHGAPRVTEEQHFESIAAAQESSGSVVNGAPRVEVVNQRPESISTAPVKERVVEHGVPSVSVKQRVESIATEPEEMVLSLSAFDDNSLDSDI